MTGVQTCALPILKASKSPAEGEKKDKVIALIHYLLALLEDIVNGRNRTKGTGLL